MVQLVQIVQWINVLIIIFELGVIYNNMRSRVHSLLYMNCVSMLVGSFGYLLTLYCQTEEAYFMTVLVSWSGKVFGVIAAFNLIACLCRYTIPKFIHVLEVLFAVLTCSFIFTTKYTGLFYRDFGIVREGQWIVADFKRGFWYHLWDIIVLFVLISCLFMLIRSIRVEGDKQKKDQLILIMSAIIIEFGIGLLTVLPISRYYDFNQPGFSIASIIMIVAILKHDLLDVESAAKDFIIDDLSAGVIATDAKGEVAYYNQTALHVFPRIRKNSADVLSRISESIRTGEPVSVGGRIYTFEEKNLDRSIGNSNRIFVIIDSTVNYRHLKELEQQKQVAEEANNAKSYFLASMSHEIRTPINTVLGMNEMILRESKETGIREYASNIKTAGNTLLSLINDILDLTKIESGKMELVPVEYDESSLIYDLINIISQRAKEKGLSFEIDIDPNIPSKLEGDDVRIKQVLMNILSNAVKYTHEGYVSFKATLKSLEHETDVNTAVIHYEVEDSGVGIKQEDMNRLFSVFERIDLEHNRNIEGTGLGMPISVKILALMDSNLKVSSSYGSGSVFSFDLLQEVVDETPIGDFSERISEGLFAEDSYNGSFSAPDAKILLVDDNEMNRKVFIALLKNSEIKISEADNGPDSIKLAASEHFDIIFMDHMMPDMDGIEAMKRIKAIKDGPCANTPLVVLTANAIAGSREKYLEEGFNGYLSKPISPDKLESTILEYLPKEKVKAGKADHNMAIGAEDDELPIVFGVDWNYALMRLQDKELLVSVVGDFVASLDSQANKLDELKNGLPGSLNDYRIVVHGMKSASGSIGIITLSGMAAELEKAATDGDLSIIEHLHDVFIKEWRNYKERLLCITGSEEAPDSLEKIDPEALKALLNMIKSAMEQMDVDTADTAVDKLYSYRLPDVAASERDNLKAAETELDLLRVTEIINRINESL